MAGEFVRTELLIGREGLETLENASILVFGVGGVGSHCIEALARCGVGRLILADSDSVAQSNINRQAFALHSTVGMKKAEAAALRLADISPTCQLHPMAARYEAQTREEFFQHSYDCIVDAIDLVSCKLDLIETAHARNIPIISAMGTGNKLDAQQLRIADLSKTEGCPLARVVRKELKARGILHHPVVFSPELPSRAHDGTETPPPGRRSIPASSMWVPASAGLLLAQWVISYLTDEKTAH